MTMTTIKVTYTKLGTHEPARLMPLQPRKNTRTGEIPGKDGRPTP